MRYRTTKEENERLTRVGAGTPMGELLRRYWWPIGLSADLKGKPTLVRLLGQDLVLFRDARGGLGVLDAQCPHRRAPLCIGRVNAQGLRCRYHGWLMDRSGKVLETPGEPACSTLKDEVRQPAYPVQELGGLIFTYIGPAPVPELPRFHMLVAEGERNVMIQGFNDCNYLQCVENGIDAHHVAFLHGDTWTALAHEPDTTWFEPHELGVIVKTISKGRKDGEFAYRQHPVLVPGISVGGDTVTAYGAAQVAADLPAATARWTVPIDDGHTVNYRIWFRPGGQNKSALEQRTRTAIPARIAPYLEYREGRSELGYDGLDDIYEQDATVFDGSGVIADRENENLSVIDDGIVLLRKILLQQMDRVARGEDPLGVLRSRPDSGMLVLSGEYQWIDTRTRDELLARIPADASR